ncbi:hypothetical protein MRX96_034672 [Rhipicephalus microplus]
MATIEWPEEKAYRCSEAKGDPRWLGATRRTTGDDPPVSFEHAALSRARRQKCPLCARLMTARFSGPAGRGG